MPAELRPLAQVIDDRVTARRLGLVIEARVGRGKLVVCRIDLQNDLNTNLVARQFRFNLLRTKAGDLFHPEVEVTPAQDRALLATR
jgi:hypothetical protein